MIDETAHQPGPNELRDPATRAELRRASIWFGLGLAVAAVVLLIQPLLLIFAGLVFAAALDGGARLIGRGLPFLPRGLRLLIVALLVTGFVGAVFYMAGVEIVRQAEQLRDILTEQALRAVHWANDYGFAPSPEDLKSLTQQGLGTLGRITSWVGSALGMAGSLVMMLSIGLFVAMDPHIYERGLKWMFPTDMRDDFSVTLARMAGVMRRLLAGRLIGMTCEGVMIWLLLWWAGVPMALLLGILTGMLAFIPNIGAFISGALMISVGFSAGVHQGFSAIAIYFAVQTFDGYVVIPLVAKHTVDLPPALTLSFQILASSLFGFLGLTLADPMVAMLKVALERKSELGARMGRQEGDAF